MKKIVFFDLDGTLLSGLSSENAFILHLFKKQYVKLVQLIRTLCFIPRWFLKYKHYVFIKNKAYLHGLSTEMICEVGKQFVTEKLLKKLRPALIERVEEHRKHGDMLVLLTGSLECLAKVFADHLNIEHVCATKCVQADNRFLGAPPLQHPFAAEKLKIAKEVCQQYNTEIEQCAAYGNSINDAYILKAVGQPVAVTPDRKLRKMAKRHGWEIIG